MHNTPESRRFSETPCQYRPKSAQYRYESGFVGSIEPVWAGTSRAQCVRCGGLNDKERKIDYLLGALSLDHKVGQLLVFGFSGAFGGPVVDQLITEYNVGGLRNTPYLRKFKRYLPAGAPGVAHVDRAPLPGEKTWNIKIPAPYLRASEYAAILNRLRRMAMDRPHGIPLHMVVDAESAEGTNVSPPGVITHPAPYGLGRVADLDLIENTYFTLAAQLKAIGIDQINSPDVDVIVDPLTRHVGTRSFGSTPELVTNCARAALRGFRRANMLGALKHFPGSGFGEPDSHYGASVVPADRQQIQDTLLVPYRTLIAENVVPAIMIAHQVYPALDANDEIATVSKPIITGLLRDELGYDGLITTDSITMGGLMAKYDVGQAAVLALDAGADVLLLKDDNSLRFEAHAAVVNAVKHGPLTEERINRSLRRLWSLKWDYGLFRNGGIVETKGLDEFFFKPEFQQVARQAASRAIHVLRDNDSILPLRPDQRILIIERVTPFQLYQNDSWNHPGQIWQCMLKYADNVSYIDYQPDSVDQAGDLAGKLAPDVDVIVVTTAFNHSLTQDMKPFVVSLAQLGKPLLLVSNNPFGTAVPDEIGSVVVTYSVMHDSVEALSKFLFEKQP